MEDYIVLIVGSRVANSRTYAFGFYTSFDSKSMVEDAISLVNRQNYILLTFPYFSPLSGGRIPTSALLRLAQLAVFTFIPTTRPLNFSVALLHSRGPSHEAEFGGW